MSASSPLEMRCRMVTHCKAALRHHATRKGTALALHRLHVTSFLCGLERVELQVRGCARSGRGCTLRGDEAGTASTPGGIWDVADEGCRMPVMRAVLRTSNGATDVSGGVCKACSSRASAGREG